MKRITGIATGLTVLATTFLFVAAIAQATTGAIGDTYRETFELFNESGTYKTEAALSNFTTSFLRDGLPVSSESASFRNHSTGAYTLVWIPSAAGWYEGGIMYNHTAVANWRTLVCARDVDDLATTARTEEAFTNISSANGAIRAKTDTLPADPAGESSQEAFRIAMRNHTGVGPEDYRADVTALLTASVFTGWTGFRGPYFDRLDADVSSRAVFADISALHTVTDGLIGGIDDDPWDAPVRGLTDRSGFSLAADQSGVTLGTVNGMTNPVEVAYASITGIDSRLSATHGTGIWDANGSVNVIPFQGTVSYETVAYGTDVHVVRGDSVAIPYSIGQDITGWTVHFGAKASPSDETYALGPKDITVYVTDASTGSGVINLDATETSVQPRRYSAELEIRSGPSVSTVLRFRLWVDPDVIR